MEGFSNPGRSPSQQAQRYVPTLQAQCIVSQWGVVVALTTRRPPGTLDAPGHNERSLLTALVPLMLSELVGQTGTWTAVSSFRSAMSGMACSARGEGGGGGHEVQHGLARAWEGPLAASGRAAE